MGAGQIAVLALAALVVVATCVPFLRRDEWFIRDFEFPRVQILVLGVAAATLFASFVDLDHWAKVLLFAALITCLVFQAYRVFPYTRLAKLEVLPAERDDPDATIALLVANVLMSNRKVARLLAMIEERDPDIVLLLEPDAQWESEMRVIEERYPIIVRQALDNTYGMLLYSRLPLIDPETRFMVSEGIPSMHAYVQLRSGQKVRLHCIHPEPPSPTEARESTDRDAELLLVGKEVEKRDDAAIVCGDLNDVAWSYTTTLFQKVSRLLDPRKGRGMFSTYNANIPMMRWPLDHIFVSEHFRFADMSRLDHFGSDHFPVYARMVLEPDKKDAHETPQADASEEREADEKVRKAGVNPTV